MTSPDRIDRTGLHVAIQAGGRSRRMGRDKATLRVTAGATFLERSARLASEVVGFERVLVVGRTRPEDWRGPEVRFAPDRSPDLGPLNGLRTALEILSRPVLMLACDQPLLSRGALEWLSRVGETSTSEHGLIAERDGRLEPLFSLYRVAVLALVERRQAQNKHSLRGLIDAGDFEIKPVPTRFWPDLLNVNLPADLDRLRIDDSPVGDP